MGEKINFDLFYKQLTDDEKQLCDLCRDWNLGKCEKCELVSRYFLHKICKEVNNMNIVLYTIDCPNCLVLEKKLKQKGVEFLKVSDKETIVAKGLEDSLFPILEVDGMTMSYKTAIQWINNQ